MEYPMGTRPTIHTVIHFEQFEWSPESVELRRAGVRVRIQKQPLQLLAVLLERPGQVVTRQELQKRLWPGDTFVHFEDGLNTAVNKLREALGDDREHPQFIETVPRYGYRFITQVEIAASASPNGDHVAAGVSAAEYASAPGISWKTKSRKGLWVALSVSLVTVCGLALWLTHSRPAFSFASRDYVLVSDFENQTGEPQLDDALRTAFTVSLEQSQHFNVFPRARIGAVLQRIGKPVDTKVTPEVGREICLRENIRGLLACSLARTGQEYALSAELIDPQTGATVRSYSERVHGEDHILEALDRISSAARADLGESLYQIHKANRPLPEVTTSSLSALKEYSEAGSLWHQSKYQDAITLWRAAVETDPDFAMAHAALGDVNFSYLVNDQPAGQREYDKALALSARTTDRERLLIQANYANDLGHVESADALYRLFLKRYPDDWQVLSTYSHLLRTHGRQQEAIAQYQELLRVAPDDATTYKEMATAYRTMGMLPEALRAYSEAFKIDPQMLSSGNVNREYGFALVDNGEVEKAEQVFSTLLADPKTRENGLRSLALLDLYQGHFASARHKFQDALLDVESRPPAALSIARVHLWLGIVAEGQGDNRELLRQLDAAAAQIKNVGPKVVFGAFVGLEYARAKATTQAEAIENLIAPLADPKSAEQAGYLHLLQGEIALAKGHSAEAIDLLTLADNSNSNSFSLEALAHAYQQSGATDQAILWYEKLTKPPNESSSWEPQQRWLAAHYTLASDYAQRGDREKAQQALAPLLDLWKDADANLKLRQQMLELQGRIAPRS
jgi:DNA-binding winged helix-turn-helix (wHTH) protein/tetratricopeptide (TPR) repeat protein